MNQVQDDEINLFELFQTLWDGKWIISAVVAIAVLLGGGFLLSKDALYDSKLNYSVNTIPPFYEPEKVSIDFQKKFYSLSVFEEWKQNNSKTSLVFEDFSATEIIDGILLSKNEDEMLAKLVQKRKGNSFVLVKSNQLPILDDFFNYANHINALLKNEYLVRAKEELKIIELRFKDLGEADSNIVDTVLSIDRFIVSAVKGASVFTIQRPTMPKKVWPNSSITLGICVVLGGTIGVFFTLVRNAITKRKEKLVKA